MRSLNSSDLTSWYQRINTVRAKTNINLSSVDVPNVKNSPNLASQATNLKTLILSHKSNTYLAYANYDGINKLNVNTKDPVKESDFNVIEAAVESLESICGNNSTTTNITTNCQTTSNITYSCSNTSCTTTYNDCITRSCDTTVCSTNSRTMICSTTSNTTTFQNWSETVSPGSGNATYGAGRITKSGSSLTTYSFSGDYTRNDCNRTYNSTSTSNYTSSNSTYSTYSSGNNTNSTNSTYSNSTNSTSANYTISNSTNTTTCSTTTNSTNATNQTVSNTTYGVVVDN